MPTYLVQKNIVEAIDLDSNVCEKYWAKNWMNAALKKHKNTMGRGHLAAYLEEVCYGTTIKVYSGYQID